MSRAPRKSGRIFNLDIPAFVAISVSVYILGILHINYEFTAFDKGIRFIIELTPLRIASVPIVT